MRLTRPVVIKALRPELAASETARRRFEREACLCSVLDNPHIQAVYDVGETNGLYYIVLQYVEGPTLKQFMGGPPPRAALRALDRDPDRGRPGRRPRGGHRRTAT